MIKIGIVPDAHVPHQNTEYLMMVRDFFHSQKVGELVVLGDWYNMQPVSRFKKTPEQLNELQDELDLGFDVLKEFSSGLTRNRSFLLGNHEERLRAYVESNAPGLRSLRDLDFRKITGLSKLGYSMHDYGDYIQIGPLYFCHGNMSSINSAFSAKKHLDQLGAPVIHGHTHKLGAYWKTTGMGTMSAYEMGYLGPLKPDYERVKQNWQHGFGIAYVDGDDYWVHPIEIRDGRFVFAGKEWSVRQ